MSAAISPEMYNFYALTHHSFFVNLPAPFAHVYTKGKDEKDKDEKDKEEKVEVEVEAVVKQSALGNLPYELLMKISTNFTEWKDIGNFCLVSRRLALSGHAVLYKKALSSRVIYPRYDSFVYLLSLVTKPVYANYVHEVVLVSEGLRTHEYGSGWAWENLLREIGEDATDKDLDIMAKLDHDHARAVANHNAFIFSGAYRKMLAYFLSCLPHLKVIKIRKLNKGEHVPIWQGPEMIKELSFYREGLNTNDIFYGGWKYDTVHHRVTQYVDEYGEKITEAGAGPQATFRTDLNAAVYFAGLTHQVEIIEEKKV
ncbi:hypothetical protein ACN47E_008804 [Coniothyrium glycines]